MGHSRAKLYIIGCVIAVSLLVLKLSYKPPGNILHDSFQDRREYHFTNGGHYGDSILNLKFFYNNAELLKKNNIYIYYYYPGHITKVEELERYVDRDCVELRSDAAVPPNSAELWMKNDIEGVNYGNNFTLYYKLFYRNILRTLGLNEEGIDTSLFQKEDYLEEIYTGLDDKYKDIDVLVINAEPKSGQFDYNSEEMNALIHELHKKFRIVTTSPMDPNIPSTMGGGLALQDIGAISTHAKYIFGIHSGPLIPCFNAATKAHVKKWILLDKTSYKFDDINYSISGSLPDAQSLLSEISIE
jgi:hypothetical protein